MTTVRSTFEGIAEQVHHHFVEKLKVEISHHPFFLRLEREGDVVLGGILAKRLHNISDKSGQIGLACLQPHLTPVEFPKVHQLVD